MAEIEDAIADVEAFLDGRYKSIYLMDSWLKIKEFIEERMKGENNEKPPVH